MARVVVLDAGVLIGLLDGSDAHHEWATQLFIDTIDDSLHVSVLTLAEVLVHPARVGRAESVQRSLEGLHLTVHPIEADQALALASLRSHSNMRMPDVVVVHLAERAGGVVATTDRTLATGAASRGLSTLTP